MKRPDSVRCGNCIFENGRTCHFNPPILDPNNEIGWPIIEDHWWCGRFRPIDNLTAVEWVTWIKGLDIDGQVHK